MIGVPDVVAIGREFVRQYYTILHVAPQYLYRFYGRDSSFACSLHPSSADSSYEPVKGQEGIRKRLSELDLTGYDVKIGAVDFQSLFRNCIVVQVIGELRRGDKLMRRFNQTFVLAVEGAEKYYIHNDILHYHSSTIHSIALTSAAQGAAPIDTLQTNESQTIDFHRGEMIIGSPVVSATNAAAKSSSVPVFTTQDISSGLPISYQANVSSISASQNSGAYTVASAAAGGSTGAYAAAGHNSGAYVVANAAAAGPGSGAYVVANTATVTNTSYNGIPSARHDAVTCGTAIPSQYGVPSPAIVHPSASTSGNQRGIMSSDLLQQASAVTSPSITSIGSAAAAGHTAAAANPAAANPATATYSTAPVVCLEAYSPASSAANGASLSSSATSLVTAAGSVFQISGENRDLPSSSRQTTDVPSTAVLPHALSDRYEEEFPAPPQRVGMGAASALGASVSPAAVGPASVSPTAVGPASVSPAAVCQVTIGPAAVSPANVGSTAVSPAAVSPAAVSPAIVGSTAVSPAAVSPAAVSPAAGIGRANVSPAASGTSVIADHSVSGSSSLNPACSTTSNISTDPNTAPSLGATNHPQLQQESSASRGGHNPHSGQGAAQVSDQPGTKIVRSREDRVKEEESGVRQGGNEGEVKSHVVEASQSIEPVPDDKPPKPMSWATLASKKPTTSPAPSQPISGSVRTSPSAPSTNQQPVRKLPRAPNNPVQRSTVGGGAGDGLESVGGGARRGSDASDASGWAGSGGRGFYPANQQLFIGNLPHHVTVEQLSKFLEGLAPDSKVIDLKINKNAQQYSNHHVPFFAFATLSSKEAVRKILDLPQNRHYLDGSHRLNIMQKLPKSELQVTTNPRPRSGAQHQTPPSTGNVGGDSDRVGVASEHMEGESEGGSGRGNMRQRYHSPRNVGSGRGNTAVRGEH